MPSPLRVLYLHGFASSPLSRKAMFLAEKFAGLDLEFERLELVSGRDQDITLTAQMAVVDKAAQGSDPLILIGSSLGGYLASLYAARHTSVTRLVLLAPAFHFHDLWIKELGPERLKFWRENGSIPVFHYGEGRDVPIGYQLLDDAAQFEPVPAFTQPALIFHGIQDAVVPVQYSEECAKTHPNARLVRVQSGHELTDVLDVIWKEIQPFVLGSNTDEKC